MKRYPCPAPPIGRVILDWILLPIISPFLVIILAVTGVVEKIKEGWEDMQFTYHWDAVFHRDYFPANEYEALKEADKRIHGVKP